MHGHKHGQKFDILIQDMWPLVYTREMYELCEAIYSERFTLNSRWKSIIAPYTRYGYNCSYNNLTYE